MTIVVDLGTVTVAAPVITVEVVVVGTVTGIVAVPPLAVMVLSSIEVDVHELIVSIRVVVPPSPPPLILSIVTVTVEVAVSEAAGLYELQNQFVYLN